MIKIKAVHKDWGSLCTANKKNRRNKKIKKFIAIFSTFVITLSFINIIQQKSSAYTEYDTYIVAAGDNIWNIAKSYQSQGDIRELVSNISSINGIKAHELQIGQELIIPRR